MWVESKGLDQIVVRSNADVEFDYFVNGVRRGYQDFQTLRQKGPELTNAERRGVRSPQRERARQARERRLRGK